MRRLEFDNVEAIKRAVEVESGDAILPLPTLEPELASRTLAAVPFHRANFARPLGIIHRRGRKISGPTLDFINQLRHGANGNGTANGNGHHKKGHASVKNFPRIQPQGLYDPQHEHDACGVGFVVDIKGRRSHQILTDALHILNNLRHRGACGCETNTGDGAGVLFQVPHEFLKVKCGQVGFALPDCGQYGVGRVYLPPDPADRYKAEKLFEEIAAHAGLELIRWRTVPTNDYTLGKTARYFGCYGDGGALFTQDDNLAETMRAIGMNRAAGLPAARVAECFVQQIESGSQGSIVIAARQG